MYQLKINARKGTEVWRAASSLSRHVAAAADSLSAPWEEKTLARDCSKQPGLCERRGIVSRGELEVFLWSSVRSWCRFRQICPELAVRFWEHQLLPCTVVTWKMGGGVLAWRVGEDVPILVLHLGVFGEKS